jgi:hypothetical protein
MIASSAGIVAARPHYRLVVGKTMIATGDVRITISVLAGSAAGQVYGKPTVVVVDLLIASFMQPGRS